MSTLETINGALKRDALAWKKTNEKTMFCADFLGKHFMSVDARGFETAQDALEARFERLLTIQGEDRPGNAPIVEIYEANADPIGFFESVLGFERMAGRWFRLSAATQRRYFGAVPFGKKALKVEEGGLITLYICQSYGTDWDFPEYRFDHCNGCFVHGWDSRPAKLPLWG